MTDIVGASAEVGGKIRDHKFVLSHLQFHVSEAIEVKRQVWNYSSADWELLGGTFENEDWNVLYTMSPDEAASYLTELILDISRNVIGQREMKEFKSEHPWMTEEIVSHVKAKREAAGTEHEKEAIEKCSEVILKTREAYIARTRAKLISMKRGSKLWWRTSSALVGNATRACSIPALRAETGEWTLGQKSKADLFAKTLSAKNFLPEGAVNEYTRLSMQQTLQELIFPLEIHTF